MENTDRSTQISIIPKAIRDAVTALGLNDGNTNILLPTQSFGEILGPYDRISIERIRINPDLAAKEVYEPGGRGKGKALGKVPIEKIANALAIQWEPRNTTILESTFSKARGKATGAMRKPNGEWFTVTEEKTIDLEVEEEKLRFDAEEEADKGRIDRWEDHRPVFVPWKDEAEKQRWIDRTVKKAIINRRRFKDEIAMTGAKERVVRWFVALKATYTDDELSKPFAFPRIILDVGKMLENPAVRDVALERMTGSVRAVFGPGEAVDVTPERKALTAEVGGGEPETEEPAESEEPSAEPSASAQQASAGGDETHQGDLFEPEDEEPPWTETPEQKVKRLREQLYVSLDSPAFSKEKAQQGRAWLANNPESKDVAKLEEKIAATNRVIERWKEKAGAGKGAT